MSGNGEERSNEWFSFSSGDGEERSNEWKIISIGILSQQQQQLEQDTTDSIIDIPPTRM